MSRLTLTALMIAAALIVLGVIFEVPFLRGGSGVFLLAGLAYAYVVAKREVELLSYAVAHRDDVYELEDVYPEEEAQAAVQAHLNSQPSVTPTLHARSVG